jgi:hypothetical protein
MFNQTQSAKGATVGNPNTEGNKKSNFSWQSKMLQVLGQIATSIPAAACCPTAATEATSLSILTALQTGREFEQLLVIDTGGAGCPDNCPTYSQIRIFNTGTNTFDPPIYYNAAGAVVVPVGPLTFVNPQFALNDLVLLLSPTARTAGMTRSSGIGSVSAGARSASFYNAGDVNATVAGALLLAGEQVSFSAGGQGDTLGAIAYDATGTDLLITTVV